jgi:type II secretory pathway pseudopilin PulG
MTLAEVLVSVIMLALVLGGILAGYVQANRMAEWSAMSLAAQSIAAQGMEQARCAQWNSQQYPAAYGPGTGDELTTNQTIIYSDSTNSIALTNSFFGVTMTTNWPSTNVNYAMDVPASGAPFSAINIITITGVQLNPPLRMIRSDCVWSNPAYGANVLFTNTMVTYRAPDQ